MIYPVLPIEFRSSYSDETMGTKSKFWVRDPSDELHLFKYGRPGTGETWAEKAAAEIAVLLGLPHADVQLAQVDGQQGTVSKRFLDKERREFLYHGNELMRLVVEDYDLGKTFKQSDHTYDRILTVLDMIRTLPPDGWDLPPSIVSGAGVFAGYLVLDALICNTDRHHENWGVVIRTDVNPISHVAMAPSYDHASSLGRELLDDKRMSILGSSQGLDIYARRGRTPIYWDTSDKRGLGPGELVRRAAEHSPTLIVPWLRMAASVRMKEVERIFASFPRGWITSCASEFAVRLVAANLKELGTILEG